MKRRITLFLALMCSLLTWADVTFTYTASTQEAATTINEKFTAAYSSNTVSCGAWTDSNTPVSVTVSGEVTDIPANTFKGFDFTSITIPEGITCINDSAFKYCGNLYNVTMPKSLSTIGAASFYGTAITNLIVPEGVTSIGDEAFFYCTALSSATIASSVQTIGYEAFWLCTNLKEVTLEGKHTEIGSSAFPQKQESYGYVIFDCNLSSIYVPYGSEDTYKNMQTMSPYWYYVKSKTTTFTYTVASQEAAAIINGKFNSSYINSSLITYDDWTDADTPVTVTVGGIITSIPEKAFDGTGLTSFSIPSSVTTIGSRPFTSCRNLASITVDEGNETYRSEGNCLIETATNTLIAGTTSSVIPNTVTEIGDWAFTGIGITSLTIPSSVTKIGPYALRSYNLITIICEGLSPATLGFISFLNTTSSTQRIYVPVALLDTYKNSWSAYEDMIQPFYQFKYQASTEANATTINGKFASAFSNVACGAWTNATTDVEVKVLGEDATTIGDEAFKSCTGLTYFYIPEGMTSIGASAFFGCTNLKAINIPASVTSIGSAAFGRCNSILTMSVAKGNTAYKYNGYCLIENATNTLHYARNCVEITIPTTVTRIGNYAFSYCTNLNGITIPASVTSIGDYAFSICSNSKFTSVTIPSTVESIGKYAFYGCSNLTSIISEGETPATLGTTGVFPSNSSLAIYVLAEHLDDYKTSWSSYKNKIKVAPQFTYTTNSNSEANKINELFDNKFKSFGPVACGTWTDATTPVIVKVYGSVTSIPLSAFSGSTLLTSITIPEEVLNINKEAFSGCSNLAAVELPKNLQTIQEKAFYQCTKLQSLVLPTSLGEIGNQAFSNCSALSSVTCERTTAPTLGTSAFTNILSTAVLRVPASVASSYSTWIKTTSTPYGYFNALVSLYGITYQQYDGTTLRTDYFEQSTAVTDVPEVPARDGYIANGWSNLTEGMTMPAQNVTCVAQYILDLNNHALVAGTYKAGDIQYTRPTSGEGKYGSFCFPFDIDLGEAVGFEKVYAPMPEILYDNQSGYLRMLLKEQSGTLKAGTPFLAKLNGEAVKLLNAKLETYAADITANPAESPLTVFNFNGSNGLLTENTGMNVTWGGTYVVTDASKVSGMNSFNTNGSFGPHSTGTLNSYRAYVTQTSVNNVRCEGILVNFDDDTTAIMDLMGNISSVSDNKVFNLSGQRVSQMKAGSVYIVNGKKVLK